MTIIQPPNTQMYHNRKQLYLNLAHYQYSFLSSLLCVIEGNLNRKKVDVQSRFKIFHSVQSCCKPIQFSIYEQYQICNIQNNKIIKCVKNIQGKLLLLSSKICCFLHSFLQPHYNYWKNSNIPLPFQTENENSLFDKFHTIAVVIFEIDSKIFQQCLELLTNVSLKHRSFPNT